MVLKNCKFPIKTSAMQYCELVNLLVKQMMARKVATHWLLGYVKRKVPFHQEPPQHSKGFTEFKVLLSSDFSDLMEISMDFKLLHHQWVLNNLRPRTEPNLAKMVCLHVWAKWVGRLLGTQNLCAKQNRKLLFTN